MSPPTDVGLLAPVWAGTAAESLTGDEALVHAMLRVEGALLRALAATGLAPRAVADAAQAVEALELDARELALASVAGGNPVIPLVEQVRASVPRDVAGHVHRGATSQDVLDTALMIVASAVCRRLESDLTSVAGFLARLCDRSRSVPMVARTLTQQALPTSLGMRASVWLAGVHDAIRVVRTCTTLPVSLGGPVGTVAEYGERGPDVVDEFARALGQRAPIGPWHGRRTPVVGLATAMTVCADACAKIATDVLVMAQTEVGEAREGTPGSSSSMAHKANPAQSVLVVSAARQVPALTSVVASSGFPEQERAAGAWHAEWQPLRSALRLAGGAAERCASYLPEVLFDHEAMAANLSRLTATLGHDTDWPAEQTAHVGVWVDRVLAQHEEVCGS